MCLGDEVLLQGKDGSYGGITESDILARDWKGVTRGGDDELEDD